MAFNFSKGVPQFPAGVKPQERASNRAAALSERLSSTSRAASDDHPLGRLPREDQDLIVQLVLHSGSLKDLAATYEVSYPTIRLRLNRVIERLRTVIAGRKPDGVTELLARMVEQGEIAPTAARAIGEAVRKQIGTP